MKAKETLIRKSSFSKPPISRNIEPVVKSKVIHKEGTKKVIEKILMTQSTSKALGPNKFNFCILRIV